MLLHRKGAICTIPAHVGPRQQRTNRAGRASRLASFANVAVALRYFPVTAVYCSSTKKNPAQCTYRWNICVCVRDILRCFYEKRFTILFELDIFYGRCTTFQEFQEKLGTFLPIANWRVTSVRYTLWDGVSAKKTRKRADGYTMTLFDVKLVDNATGNLPVNDGHSGAAKLGCLAIV